MEIEKLSGIQPSDTRLTPVRPNSSDNHTFEAGKPDAISFALARIRDPAISLYGRVRVAGDKDDSGVLERKILERVLIEYPEWSKPWKTADGTIPHKKDFVRAIVRLALFEETYGHWCPNCYGRRWQYQWEAEHQAKRWGTHIIIREVCTNKKCRRCKGVGVKPWNDADRAFLLKINYNTYHSTWADRVRRVKYYFNEFEHEISRRRL